VPSATTPAHSPRITRLQEEMRFKVLHALQQQPGMNQRQLAEQLGVSLGKTNYLLRALVEKGLLKARNFRNSQNKLLDWFASPQTQDGAVVPGPRRRGGTGAKRRLPEKAYVAAISGTKAPALKVGDCVVAVDPRYFRTTEVETLLGDPSKAKTELGWVPEITAQQMCAAMVAEDVHPRFETLSRIQGADHDG
jgi:GDP-D-mannose dehydratase